MEMGQQQVGPQLTPILLLEIQVAVAAAEAEIKVLDQMAVLELSLFVTLHLFQHQLPQQEALR
jgi:hypothetical protein